MIFGGDGEVWSDENECYVPPEPAVLEVGMTEADLSNTGLKAGGAIIVGAWISHKDNGALTTLNISDNLLGGYHDDRGRWISDMTGVKALAAAIPECK